MKRATEVFFPGEGNAIYPTDVYADDHPYVLSYPSKFVDVEVMVVLGIGDRRFQALAHVPGNALARKLKVGERARNLLAADHLRDEVELLRRDPQHLAHSLGLVFAEVPFALALAHDVTL